MTLEEIKAAVLAGKRVCWANRNYEVACDDFGQWLIRCKVNDYTTGLTWRDGVTMNGKPEEFFVNADKLPKYRLIEIADEACAGVLKAAQTPGTASSLAGDDLLPAAIAQHILEGTETDSCDRRRVNAALDALRDMVNEIQAVSAAIEDAAIDLGVLSVRDPV